MFLKGIKKCLLFFTLIYLLHAGAENVFTASEGESVNLPCHLPQNDSELVSVEWTKHSVKTALCTFNNKMTRPPTQDCIRHFKLNRESFILSIENVQPSDSGYYSCKTMRLIPPPSLENITNVTLQVEVRPHLSLQLLNSGNDTCIHLLCSIEDLTTELVNFTWRQEGQSSLHQFTSNSTSSELHLCKPDWSEGDTITCYANYSGNQTNKSILLPSQNTSDKAITGNMQILLLIISSSAAAGLILCIILPVVICKCRKQDEHGSIVFSNKVYENFSFAMARQNTQPIDKPQPEECIYEN